MGNDMFMRLQLQLTDKVSGELGKISKSTKLSTQALKANRDQLRGLEKSMGLIQKLKKEQEAFKQANAAMRKNQAELIGMKKSGASTAAQIKAQTALVKKNAAAFESQKQKLIGLRQVASNSGIKNLVKDEKRLASEISNTTQKIKQQDSALRQMEKIRAQRDKALKVTAAVGATGLGMRMLGMKGLNTSKSVLSSGMNFDANMAGLQGLLNLSGSSKDLARLREAALAISHKDSALLTESMGAMAQAGFTVDQIISSLPTLVTAADASLMNMSDTAASFSGVMKGFGVDYGQFAQITDQLTAAGAAGNLSISKLNEALSTVAPTARASGISLQQTAAMLGSLNKTGIDASDSSTALNAVMRNLQAPSSSTVKALSGIGIKSGMAKDIPELLQMISKRTGGMSDARTMEMMSNIFGNKNAAVMSQLMNQMRSGSYNGTLEQVMGSNGSASTLAAQNSSHLSSTTDDLKASLSNLGVTLFEMNKEWLQDLALNAIKIVKNVRAWMIENKALVGTLSKIFMVGSAVLAVLGTFLMTVAAAAAPMIMFRFAIKMLGVQFGGLIGAFKGLAAVARAHPIIALLTALAFLAYKVYQNWDSFVWFFREMWDLVSGIFQRAIGSITWLVKDLWTSISGFFNSGIGNITASIVNWSPLGLFYEAFAAVLGWFGIELPETFTGFGGMLLDGLVNGITGAMGRAKEAIQNVGGNIIGWFREKLGIKSPSRIFMSAGLDITRGAASGITQGLPVVKSASLQLARQAESGLPHFDGERFMTNGSTVRIDSRSSMSSVGRSTAPIIGGDTYHFNITGDSPNQQELIRIITQEMDKREQLKQAKLRSIYRDN